MNICISVGHSMLKNGAITSADGTKLGGGNEYKFCKDFSTYLKKQLEKTGHDVTVVIVPEKRCRDVTEERKYKISKYNAESYDLNLELHLNAAGTGQAEGTESLYVSKSGKKYAEAITEKMSKLYKDRGVKENKHLYFLNTTKAPATLIELFFCTNKKEWKKAQKNKEKMASLITEAIETVNK